VSCQDQFPVRESFEFAPLVAVQPTGVVTEIRSASKVGLSTQLFSRATLHAPVVTFSVQTLREWKYGVPRGKPRGIHWLNPRPFPAKSAQRSPAKTMVVCSVPFTAKKNPVCVTWL
jgi:hypothetical protein